MMEFAEFDKIARLSRECVITEKIDGTNGCIAFDEDLQMLVGSRTRWLSYEADNFGFYKWAMDRKEDLSKMGPGRHYGEFWGHGIQRGYDLPKGEKRFSLFNTAVWNDDNKPVCCHVVPVLHRGTFDTVDVNCILAVLAADGSRASPGYMKPEGVVIYHTALRGYFKKTIIKDEEWKGKQR